MCLRAFMQVIWIKNVSGGGVGGGGGGAVKAFVGASVGYPVDGNDLATDKVPIGALVGASV